jgi:hypothetical protein
MQRVRLFRNDEGILEAGASEEGIKAEITLRSRQLKAQ